MKMVRLFAILFILLPGSLTLQAQDFRQTAMASYYADKFAGRTTAKGDKYRHSRLSAAHRTLQFGTRVKVTNTGNQR